MESIGEHLKKEREAKKISLREVADATNITLRFLEAIEQEDFELLPGDIFVKGFMKTYAEYIGLDSSEVLKKYQSCFDKIEASKGEQTSEQDSTLSVNVSPGKKSCSLWLAIFGILILAGLGYYLWGAVITHNQTNIAGKNIAAEIDAKEKEILNEASKSDVEVSEIETGAASVEEHSEGIEKTVEVKEAGAIEEQSGTLESIVSPDASENKTLRKPEAVVRKPDSEKPDDESIPAAESPGTEVSDLTIEKKQVMKLIADSDAWMLVRVDDAGDQKDFILREGEKITFKADEKFTITTGNAAGLKIFFNGKKVAWPEGANVVHDFVLTKTTENKPAEAVVSPPDA